MPNLRFVPTVLSLVFIATAFAGCSGGGPTAAAFVCTPSNAEKTTYKCDASTSTGSDLVYEWDFGDKSGPANGPVAEHTYQYPNGDYTVKLSVVGGDGVKSEMEQKVTVGSAPNSDPKIYLFTDKRQVAPSEGVVFDASQSFDPDGDPIEIVWDFNHIMNDDELNNLENLGGHRYGKFKNGPPPGGDAAGTPASSDNSTDNGSMLLTPSGHVWADEMLEARQRQVDRAIVDTGITGFHGADGLPEPRNEGFDGKINDTSPIQVFEFPSVAVYIVHVKVFDIKGAVGEGYIKIDVVETPIKSVDVNETSGSLQSNTVFGGAQLSPEFATYHEFPFTTAFPALVELSVTATAGAFEGAAPPAFHVLICGQANQITPCRAGPAAATEVGPGPQALSWQMPIASVGSYKVVIDNQGDTPVDYTIQRTIILDVNPWYLTDAGLAQGH